MADDTQTRRKLESQIENESRWLQRTLFDLGKAREARAKHTEISGETLDPLIVLDDGTRLPLDRLEEIIQARVDILMQDLGQRPPPRG